MMSSSPSTVIDMQQLLHMKQRVQSARIRRETFAERLASSHRRVSAAAKSAKAAPPQPAPPPPAQQPQAFSAQSERRREESPRTNVTPPFLKKFFSPRLSSAGPARKPPSQEQSSHVPTTTTYDMPCQHSALPHPSPRDGQAPHNLPFRRSPQVSTGQTGSGSGGASGGGGGFCVQPHHQLRRALTEAVSHTKLLIQQADDLRENRLAERQKVAECRSAEWRKVTAGNLLAFGADVQTVRRMLNGELSEIVEEVVRCISAASYLLSSGASSWLRPRSASSSSTTQQPTSDHLRESLVEGGALGLRLCDGLALVGDHCSKFVHVCCPAAEAELASSLVKGLSGLVASGREVLLRILDTHDRRRVAEVLVEESKQPISLGTAGGKGAGGMSPAAASIQRWFSTFDMWWAECRAAIDEIPPSTHVNPTPPSAQHQGKTTTGGGRPFSSYPTPPPTTQPFVNPFLNDGRSSSFAKWHSRPPSAGSARPQSGGTSRPASAQTSRPSPSDTANAIFSSPLLLLDSLAADETAFAAFLATHGTVDAFLRKYCESNSAWTSSSSSQVVSMIPWPSRSLLVLKQYLGAASDTLVWSRCRQPLPDGFIGAPTVGDYLRLLQRRWHPDRLQNALPTHSDVADECAVDDVRAEVMRRATTVAQAINAAKELLNSDASVA